MVNLATLRRRLKWLADWETQGCFDNKALEAADRMLGRAARPIIQDFVRIELRRYEREVGGER